MATTTEAVEAPTTISETEAARRLNVKASTLRLWRTKGKLADGLVTETPSLVPGGRPNVSYDAEWIGAYVTDRNNIDDGTSTTHAIFA